MPMRFETTMSRSMSRSPGLAHNILLEPIAMERVKDIAGAMLCFAVFMAASLVLLAMSVRAALIVF
jgi:hypothetical protein